MPRFRPAILLLSAALAAAAPAVHAQPAMDDAQRKAIEGVVRDYLMKNPEIILEAVGALQEREKAAKADLARQAIQDRLSVLVNDPAAPVAGNPRGDVTVVEFFDYQCGYCKAVQGDVERLMKEDGKLRVVFKELPILGPASLVASKAALASRGQGKYLDYHNALMGHRGQLDEAVILRLAKSVGLDTDRLKADMESAEVAKAIADNQKLAEELGIRGTPAFVIGEELVPGAIKLDDMKSYVDAARKG